MRAFSAQAAAAVRAITKQLPLRRDVTARHAKHGVGHRTKKAHGQKQSHHAARLARRRARAITGVVHTEVDRIYEQVQHHRQLQLHQLGKTLHMPYHTTEAWCERLAERNLVSVHYPAVGRAYVRLVEQERPSRPRRRWVTLAILLLLLVIVFVLLANNLGLIDLSGMVSADVLDSASGAIGTASSTVANASSNLVAAAVNAWQGG